MRIKKGQRIVKLSRPIGQAIHARIAAKGGLSYPLIAVQEDYMRMLVDDINMHIDGMPTHYYIDDENIMVWPTPDQNYRIKLIFYPPAEEQ